MKKNKKAKLNAPKVTEAFIAVASDYIQLAEDVDAAGNLAYLAVIAWNISLYPKDQIPEKIDLIARSYEKSNPGVIKAELLSQDLQTLVDKKLMEYPDIRRTITKIGVRYVPDVYKPSDEGSELIPLKKAHWPWSGVSQLHQGEMHGRRGGKGLSLIDNGS